MSDKKIALVTGGAGFIGSHMVDLLLIKNFRVRVIDNFCGGHEKNLIQHKGNKDLFIKNISILDILEDEEFFQNVSYVFHFAGLGDIVPSIEKPEKYIETNVLGTLKVLQLLVIIFGKT